MTRQRATTRTRDATRIRATTRVRAATRAENPATRCAIRSRTEPCAWHPLHVRRLLCVRHPLHVRHPLCAQHLLHVRRLRPSALAQNPLRGSSSWGSARTVGLACLHGSFHCAPHVLKRSFVRLGHGVHVLSRVPSLLAVKRSPTLQAVFLFKQDVADGDVPSLCVSARYGVHVLSRVPSLLARSRRFLS